MDNDELIRGHLEYLRMRGRAQNTITARRRAVARAAAWLGPVPLAAATEADLIAWRASLAGLADVSVISAVAHVRGFYCWAVSRHLIEANPALLIPVPAAPEWEPHPISEHDLAAALAGAPQPVRLWLVLGAWCGMRCVEIALLRRSCVRERDEQPSVVIRKDATKGRRRGRTIELCAFAAAEITAAGLPSSGWCFPHPARRGEPVTAHYVSNRGNGYLHQAGITGTMHWLRHRYATELLDACGDPRLVQDQLGHASLDMVPRYTRVRQQRAAAAAAALPVPQSLRKAG